MSKLGDGNRETRPLWGEILAALNRLGLRDDLTAVEADAVQKCLAAVGDVVIEQEAAPREPEKVHLIADGEAASSCGDRSAKRIAKVIRAHQLFMPEEDAPECSCREWEPVGCGRDLEEHDEHAAAAILKHLNSE